MVHGWPLLSAALTACVLLWGSVRHHVEREASRFIPSRLSRRWTNPDQGTGGGGGGRLRGLATKGGAGHSPPVRGQLEAAALSRLARGRLAKLKEPSHRRLKREAARRGEDHHDVRDRRALHRRQ